MRNANRDLSEDVWLNVVMRVLNYAINVSQVPQRSPFRFPGGKTWLIPVLRHWLKSQKNRTEVFVEPFAGGASASLMAVAEGYCDRAYLSEIDASVASVWSCVLSNTGTELADEVESFKMTIKNVDELFRVVSNGATSAQQALAVLVRNRVHRGGILAEGAGRLKKGENGKGISSRWYPETIARRLREISKRRKKLRFSQCDGFALLKKFGQNKKAVAFVDPPYFGPAHRLYTHWKIDHEMLFETLNNFQGDFLLAYDDAVEIRKLAKKYKLKMAVIEMKTTHHQIKREILISRNLNWLFQRIPKS
jgi:DNA adenine methylase